MSPRIAKLAVALPAALALLGAFASPYDGSPTIALEALRGLGGARSETDAVRNEPGVSRNVGRLQPVSERSTAAAASGR